jgi:hypothetical protein
MTRLINRRTVLVAAATSPIVAACSESEIRRRQPSPIALANVWPWGVNTFLDLEVETWKRRQTVKMVSDAGIRWMKQHIPWADLEVPGRGEYFDASARRSTWVKYDEIVDLAEQAGVEIIARIDRAPAWARPNRPHPTSPPEDETDFEEFLFTFADRYGERIRYYQIWNEPNLANEWGGVPPAPEAYARLLSRAFAVLKSVDKRNIVIAAPLAATLENSPRAMDELTFVERMYEAGGGDYLDVQAANAFGLEHPPEAAPDRDVLNFRRVEFLRELMVEFGLGNKPIWFNEYGWNASPDDMSPAKLVWQRVSEEQQAEWSVEGVRYGLNNWPWAGVFNIWFFRKPASSLRSDQSEYFFRMVDPDFTPRLIYRAVKRAATGVSFP